MCTHAHGSDPAPINFPPCRRTLVEFPRAVLVAEVGPLDQADMAAAVGQLALGNHALGHAPVALDAVHVAVVVGARRGGRRLGVVIVVGGVGDGGRGRGRLRQNAPQIRPQQGGVVLGHL